MNSLFLVLFIFLQDTHAMTAETFPTIAIANKQEGTASFLNLNSGKSQKVTVGYLPHEITTTKTHAYVSNYGHAHVRSSSLRDKSGNTLSVINLSKMTLEKEISLGESKCAPHGIVTSDDERFIYVTCEAKHEVLVIDTLTNEVLHTLPTQQPGSHMLVLDQDKKAYVANFWIGTVTVLDLKTRKILNQIKTGRTTEGITLSSDGLSLYVSVVEANEIVKIDTRTSQILARKSVGERKSPVRVLFAEKQNLLVVNHSADNSVGFYHPDSLELIKRVEVGKLPIGITLDHKNAYVSNMLSGSITVIDLNTLNTIKEIKTLTEKPDGVSLLK